MEKVTIWRRFKGWATALKSKYTITGGNLLLVTRVKTLAVHLGFVLVLLLIFWLFLNYAQEQILAEVLATLERALETGQQPNPEDLRSLSVQLKTTYVVFFAGILGVMGVVLYFLAGVTLRPIRQNMELQRRFIADVTHELRTPLSVMQSEAEVALLDGASDDDRREALEVNIEEINRVSLIINNLISFTHVSGLSSSSFTSVDLNSVLERARGKLRPMADKGEIDFSAVRGEDPIVFGNEIALEQVAINLGKNAIAHTSAGGQVTMRARKNENGRTELEVTDTGDGIPQGDIGKIFEPFFKSGASKVAESGNVGLGLSIVQQVVKSHNGKLDVDSTVGEGTTMTVTLPSAKETQTEKS